jgi:excinuclease UvrABC nuclease subunit
MDSSSVGISSWTSFACATERELLASLPELPGVYVVVLAEPAPRIIGRSDIAYIGKATNRGGLRGRVRQYFHPGPTQSTNLRMNERILPPDCTLRIGFIVTESTDAARHLEADLLARFGREHGERPPFNRNRPSVSPLARKR